MFKRYLLILPLLVAATGCHWILVDDESAQTCGMGGMDCQNVSESCGKDWPILASKNAFPRPLHAILAKDDGLVVAGDGGYLAWVNARGEVQEHSDSTYGDINSIQRSNDTLYIASSKGIFETDIVSWPPAQLLHAPPPGGHCLSLWLAGTILAAACENQVVTGTPTSLSPTIPLQTQPILLTAAFGNDNTLWAGDSLGGLRHTNSSAITWSSRDDGELNYKKVHGGTWEGGDVFYAVGEASLIARHEAGKWTAVPFGELGGYYDSDNFFSAILTAQKSSVNYYYIVGGNTKKNTGMILSKKQSMAWGGLVIQGERYLGLQSDDRNIYVVGSKDNGTAGVIRCRPLDG